MEGDVNIGLDGARAVENLELLRTDRPIDSDSVNHTSENVMSQSTSPYIAEDLQQRYAPPKSAVDPSQHGSEGQDSNRIVTSRMPGNKRIGSGSPLIRHLNPVHEQSETGTESILPSTPSAISTLGRMRTNEESGDVVGASASTITDDDVEQSVGKFAACPYGRGCMIPIPKARADQAVCDCPTPADVDRLGVCPFCSQFGCVLTRAKTLDCRYTCRSCGMSLVTFDPKSRRMKGKTVVKKKQPVKLELKETNMALELRSGLKLMSNHFEMQLGQISQEITGALRVHTQTLQRLDERAGQTDRILAETLARVTALEAGREPVRSETGHEEPTRTSVRHELDFAREPMMRSMTPHVSRIPPNPSSVSPNFESALRRPKQPIPSMDEEQLGLASQIPATASAIVRAMGVNDDERLEEMLTIKMNQTPRQGSITGAALKALLDGRLRVSKKFSGKTVPGVSSLMAVPLGEGFANFVADVFADKFRYCLLQEHDLALLLMCLDEQSGLRRSAAQALTHGTSLRICLFYVSQKCPNHGDGYESNRWAGLKTLADAVNILRAQGYEGDIYAAQVLSVIQEFGMSRTNRDRIDMAITLLPDAVMQMLTGHLPPQERANVIFENLLESAPSVLFPLQKEVPTLPRPPKSAGRHESPGQERPRGESWVANAGWL